MQQTPFHTYYMARELSSLSAMDKLVPVFASSDITAYPFQIAAASFALRSPYQKGIVLCDEAGMGKSHEAMLIVAQKWLEGQNHILLVVPNADLLTQWTELIDRYYTIPYVSLTNRADWNANISDENTNAFEQNAVVITTYDFAAVNEDAAKSVRWDLTVFEEANALSSAYQEENKQAKALKRIAESSFKLLLTGTPIEKNIMDLFGLLWFIDETILPGEQEFLTRYLRRPENYPELAEKISKYCFRTLRSQARHYAKVTERILITNEYEPSAPERKLYDLLYAYANQPDKLAFPEMDQYDLALRLLSLQSSSSAAILQTIKGVIKRLESLPAADNELNQWREMQAVAESVPLDAKAKHLLTALKSGFALIKKCGANKKAVIFTESAETQKMLYTLLRDKYKSVIYNGAADYSAIRIFKENAEILISTDNGAKGFNLEEAAFIIHYDLPFNTLKMEQRIDRCHRLGQENDVLSLAFIDKNNFSDVRKLELVNKRMLVSNGVFGVSDDVLGGFTDDFDAALAVMSKRIRPKAQVEADYQQTLLHRENENRQLVTTAEDIFFSTFTKELSDKVTITPRYLSDKAKELDEMLWHVAKMFFEQYNADHDDCCFEIDDAAKTITATKYETLPTLFYYWNGSRNVKYQSREVYGMAKDYHPRQGRITLTSAIGRGLLQAMECADCGELTVNADVEPCEIGLYTVTLTADLNRMEQEYAILCGQTESGATLNNTECKNLLAQPVLSYTESERKTAHWLKNSDKPHALDQLLPIDALIAAQIEQRSPAQNEEIEQMKLQTAAKKNALLRDLGELEIRLKTLQQQKEMATGTRMQRLALDKQQSLLRKEYLQKQENQFIDAMRLDVELEHQIEYFMEKEKLTAIVTREYVVRVEGA